MDSALFERLLFEEESTTLDFKKEQYRFVKATDDDKSELLKDILGFANAWRRSEAYILIGVENVRGSRSRVVGISEADHLDDHSLQQFVYNLTNYPVRFHYEAFKYEDEHIGIIRIEEQRRPVYLKRDYGKLGKEQVYVRRGSSTAPNKSASLDEIAQMGQSNAAQSAEIVVEFAEIKGDDSLGAQISLDAEYCEMPYDDIPDHGETRHRHSFDFSVTERNNAAYYRDLAVFEFLRRLYHPVRLLVKNTGTVASNHVRCELTIPKEEGLNFVNDSQLPSAPERRSSVFAVRAVKDIRPAVRDPGNVTIEQNDQRFRIEIECGNLQPGRRIWSEVIYLGKASTGKIKFSGQLFADNLEQPKEFGLEVSINVNRTTMTVKDLLDLPDPAIGDI